VAGGPADAGAGGLAWAKVSVQPPNGSLPARMSVLGSSVDRKMTSELAVTFPACLACGQFRTGPAAGCMACARPRLERPGASACPVCDQRLRKDGRCANELCNSPRRRISGIHAIAYQSGPLRRAINRYKYRGEREWSVLFGRLLLAWLDDTHVGDPPDLIVANPSFVGPGGQAFAHTEAVLESAARETAGRTGPLPVWSFDTQPPRAVVKTMATLRSADTEAWSKHASALELRSALAVPDPARTAGRYILVYDDICTTGGQLDAVAGCLIDDGRAARVEGVVLARAPWRGTPR
jgi:predicted amidophosphoribosyltransferase